MIKHKKKNWRKIKLILLDVDGVLTNGLLTYTDTGAELKSFNVRDGWIIQECVKLGLLEFGIITARKSAIVQRRAKELNVKYLYENYRDKLAALNDILEKTNYSPDEIMFVGDELMDAPVMLRVGISATVNDCATGLKKIADFVATKNGGAGAVREIIEELLKKQGKLKLLFNEYLK